MVSTPKTHHDAPSLVSFVVDWWEFQMRNPGNAGNEHMSQRRFDYKYRIFFRALALPDHFTQLSFSAQISGVTHESQCEKHGSSRRFR